MLTLRSKFTLLLVAVVAATVFLLAAADIWSEIARAEARAQERQERSLRVAATMLDLAEPGASVRTDAAGGVAGIEWTAPPALGGHALIDRIGAATNETVTVFVHDEASGEFVRRSTNIVKPDGTRAVGTALGRDGEVHPVVAAGGVYRGEATILGRDYHTVYYPIRRAGGGRVDGVLYVASRRPMSPRPGGRTRSGARGSPSR